MFESSACWMEAIDKYQSLIPLLGQKEIYASATAIEAIRQFMSEFHKLIDEYLRAAGLNADPPQCGACLERLQDAGQRLAQEARRHLGLPELTGKALDPSARFTGSFRGRLQPPVGKAAAVPLDH